jgi:hypothetical protein
MTEPVIELAKPTGNVARRPGVTMSKAAAVAGVLLYVLHLGIIQVLSQNVQKLEDRVHALERENGELQRKLEILNVVDKHQRGFSQLEVAQLVGVIDGESRRFGIDPLLILAVILTESELGVLRCRRKGHRSHADSAVVGDLPWARHRLNEQVGLFDPELNVRLHHRSV